MLLFGPSGTGKTMVRAHMPRDGLELLSWWCAACGVWCVVCGGVVVWWWWCGVVCGVVWCGVWCVVCGVVVWCGGGGRGGRME
jgi:hypothetical protein